MSLTYLGIVPETKKKGNQLVTLSPDLLTIPCLRPRHDIDLYILLYLEFSFSHIEYHATPLLCSPWQLHPICQVEWPLCSGLSLLVTGENRHMILPPRLRTLDLG